MCRFDPLRPGVLVSVDVVDPDDNDAAAVLSALFGTPTPSDGWPGHEVDLAHSSQFLADAWELALAEQTSLGYPLDLIDPNAPGW